MVQMKFEQYIYIYISRVLNRWPARQIRLSKDFNPAREIIRNATLGFPEAVHQVSKALGLITLSAYPMHCPVYVGLYIIRFWFSLALFSKQSFTLALIVIIVSLGASRL